MNSKWLVFTVTRWFYTGAVFFCLVYLLIISSAYAAGLGAISPGGVDPSRQDEISLPQKSPEYFPIPPVQERPLDINEGPKVNITAIRLTGVVEHEDISLDSLSHLTKKILAEQIALSRKETQSSALTIGQIQFIADKLTQYYRQKGYILAQAYLPPQKVQDGSVLIKIIEGQLGAVSVRGNEIYDQDIYKKPFQPSIHTAVNKYEMERLLLLINDFPGFAVTGSFKRGSRPGTTDLELLVQDEDRFGGFIRYDNYGSEYTGDRRTLVGMHVNGLFKQVNQLNFQVLKADSPSNSDYYAVNFEQLVFDEATYLGFSYNTNDYTIGRVAQALGITGDSETTELYLRRAFIRSREHNIYGRLSLAGKRATSESEFGVRLAKDKLTVLSGQLIYDGIDERFNGINMIDLSYHRGLGDTLGSMDGSGDESAGRRGGSGDYAGGDFDRWNLNIARVQSLPYDQSLIFKLNSQYSDDLLTSLEQFQLGGPNSVRAYPVSEYLSDKGYLVSLEWNVGLPLVGDYNAFAGRKWRDIINLSFFYDSTKGWINDPLSFQKDSIKLEGYGFAVQLKEIYGVLGRFYMAKPVGKPEPSNDRDPQYYFELSYHF